MKKICVLKGDGIGPEVIDATVMILKHLESLNGPMFKFEEALIGATAIQETGSPLPQETIDKCKDSDAVLLGAIGDPLYDNDPTLKIRPEQGLLRLRKELDLFANIRPLRIYDSLKHLSVIKEKHLKNVDLVIYRELTGGIYFGKKEKTSFTASDECLYHEYEIIRIAKLAFEAAVNRKGKLTLVDKANVLESSRLWRLIVRKMSKEYPELTVDYLYIDNAAMQLVLNPSQFDVILTSNMFGDILSDLASVLGGSIGLLPSSSKGAGVGLYEPVHGSYPSAKGKNIANPIATILSASMMLNDLGMEEEAALIQKGIDHVIEKNILTEDLVQGTSTFTTSKVAEAVKHQVSRLSKNKILVKI